MPNIHHIQGDRLASFQRLSAAMLTAATALILAAPAHADTTPLQPDLVAILL
ncbi:hypothetical protein ACIBHX_49015 [Nonomuraea sp. NPDC050536]|uniref:hypothetical protein n=1 Tax=Nonomuraea sp. NPDC050536 TaxID=3364366 RepID=UPI0037C8C56B